MTDPTEKTQFLSTLVDQTHGQLLEGKTREAGRLGGCDIAIAGACSVDEGSRCPVALAETWAWSPAHPVKDGAGRAQFMLEPPLKPSAPYRAQTMSSQTWIRVCARDPC